MSSCLFCHYGLALLDAPVGKPGDPVGLCVKCKCLTCGWHGARTSSPAFVCLVCDVNGLLASAGWDAFKRAGGLDRLPRGRAADTAPGGGTHAAAADLARALATLFSTTDGEPSRLVVATLMQWLAERPSYERFGPALGEAAAWAVEVINRFFRESGGGRGQYTPGTRDQQAVHAMWNNLGDDGRRLLAAAVLLIVALDLPEQTLPPPVVAVAQFLDGLLRDHPGRIEALREQIIGNPQR